MHRLEYLIAKLLFTIFNTISLSAGKRIAFISYIFVAKIIRYRRSVILNNLKRVYGDDLPMDKKILLRGIYKNFIYLWMEYMQVSWGKRESMIRNCTFHNLEYVDKALELGKGLIMMTGHFGNFEWFAYVMAMQGYKVSGIAKRQSNPYVNEIIHKIRRRFGTQVIYVNTAMKDGLKALNNNEIIGLVADQDAKQRGIFVDFLGQSSSTAVGPAVFHLRSGAPIIFCIAIRRDYGKFDVYINPPFEVVDGPVTDEKIRNITETHVTELEKCVLKYPEQWFWTHRRWKTSPQDLDKNGELA